MVFKLYGIHMGFTKVTALVLKEKEIPFQFYHVDLFGGENRTEQFRAEKNPFGKVPVLDDGDFRLYESRAIVRYICKKYADKGPSLVPTGGDLKAEALFEQAWSIEATQFAPLAFEIATQYVVPKLGGIDVADYVLEECVANLNPKLDSIEKVLANRKYWAGDEFTVVDLGAAVWAQLLETCPGDIMNQLSRPNIARWWKTVKERPSIKAFWEEIIPIE